MARNVTRFFDIGYNDNSMFVLPSDPYEMEIEMYEMTMIFFFSLYLKIITVSGDTDIA